jgi:CubicO group peptidase (beta-lactamase class C family)
MVTAAVALAPVAVTAVAAPAPAASAKVTIDPARIDRMLRDMIAKDRVAGASVVIWKDGREVYYRTAGYADREAKLPIRRDSLFQVFSMTKPVTGVGVMRLWEEGRFGLDEPVAKYLPEFGAVKVFQGLDAAGQPILKTPDRPILIRDLVRHSSGIGYWDGPTYPEKVLAKVDPLNVQNTLADASSKLATIPLMFEPGTQWRYSAAVDVQARLIEVLTGMPFEAYMHRNVLRPLRMKDSAWTQPEANFARAVKAYRAGADGKLAPMPEADFRKLSFSDRKLTMGGAGLTTTIDDYMRFARMMLNQGSLDGVRILKPSTVRLMATDQLDPKITERLWLGDKGNGGFGVDLFVRKGQPKSASENRGATGEFFWDGAWSTLFWVDPFNNMAVVFLVQRDPFDGSLHHDIREAVYGRGYLGPKGD